MKLKSYFKNVAKLAQSIYMRVFGFIVLLAAIFYFLNSPIFALKHIHCKTQYGPCSTADEEKLGSVSGQNLFFYNLADQKSSLEGLFTNRKVYIEKIFPDTINVSIEKRKAVTALGIRDEVGVYLVDRDGIVIVRAKESYLPSLEVEAILPDEGGLIEEELQQAVKIFYLTYKAQGVRAGKVQNGSLEIQIQDTLVIFPLDREPQILVGSLQLILVRSRIEDKLPKLIDLRYSKPVLTYGSIENARGN